MSAAATEKAVPEYPYRNPFRYHSVLRRVRRLRDRPGGPFADPELLLLLEAYFGKDLLSGALEILDYKPPPSVVTAAEANSGGELPTSHIPIVRHYVEGKENFLYFWTVRGSRGLCYSFRGVAYCACNSFARSMHLYKGPRPMTCRHVVAWKLGVSAGMVVDRRIENREEFIKQFRFYHTRQGYQ